MPLYVAFDPEAGAPTLDELTAWLADAVGIDVDTEGCDDPHGFASASVNWDAAETVTAGEYAEFA